VGGDAEEEDPFEMDQSNSDEATIREILTESVPSTSDEVPGSFINPVFFPNGLSECRSAR
jgi:hypothetical protein